MTVTREEVAAIGRIRRAFERVVLEGLRAESVAGASDEQIDAWAAAQGVATVPVAVREALRIVGVTRGLWLAGSAMGVEAVTARSKGGARACAAQLPNAMRDAAGLLVLVDHQAYTYHVIDGSDLAQPDPPVWLIIEDEHVGPHWTSVTEWFDHTAPDVDDYRTKMRLMREMGHTTIPDWGRYLR